MFVKWMVNAIAWARWRSKECDQYGLDCDDEYPEDIYVEPSLVFELRIKVWLSPGNHNYLRISRILKSATMLGFRPYALGLFDYLDRLFRQAGGRIGSEAYTHWRRAAGR